MTLPSSVSGETKLENEQTSLVDDDPSLGVLHLPFFESL